jgi:hypothetical protein
VLRILGLSGKISRFLIELPAIGIHATKQIARFEVPIVLRRAVQKTDVLRTQNREKLNACFQRFAV